jgi:hypothetical protein
LEDGGATVSLHEHGAGCDGNGAFVFRLGEPGQSESEGEKSERECGGGGVRSVFISAPGLATWRRQQNARATRPPGSARAPRREPAVRLNGVGVD